jgi:hypothetical protein
LAKKNRNAGDDPARPPADDRGRIFWIVAGVATVLVSAGIAIAIFTLLGGSSLSDDDDGPDFASDVPQLTGEPVVLDRSSAADLLAATSFDDMTSEQLALVKAEAERAFANVDLRATSAIILGIDLLRRDGVTRATRQYSTPLGPDGEPVFSVATTYYCDSEVEGFIDVFRIRRSVVATVPEGERVQQGTQPFQRVIEGTDWAEAKDLGFEDIRGRRTHGVEVTFVAQDGATTPRQIWLDVETAQMHRRTDILENGQEQTYEFDWRKPERIVPDPEIGKPPCYGPFYDDDEFVFAPAHNR